MYSVTENKTATPVSKGSQQKTVKENTHQLIAEVEGDSIFAFKLFINSIVKLTETRSKMKFREKEAALSNQ